MRTKTIPLWAATLLLFSSTQVLAAGPVMPGKLGINQAQQYQYVAETLAQAKRQGAVNAGGVNWQCSGTRCTAAGPLPTPSVTACTALAQQIGAVKSYGHSQRGLSGAETAQCNASIPPHAKPEAKHGERLITSNAFAPATPTPAPAVQRPATPVPNYQPPPTNRTAPDFVQNKSAPHLKAPPGPPPQAASLRPAAGSRGAGFAPMPNPTGSASFADAKKASPPPSGGFAPAKTATTRPSGPASFTTDAFTLTGTGALAARAPFSPRSVTTEALTATGIGALTARLPFSPRTLTTYELSVTGTGALR